ncbi:Ig-like domain-containing protein, partial [Marivirga sp.]|uniref:Ig-like domain-containing protein n=1 Tax=Marivirga sp. TaxID=2018662 RepID=UPI0025EBA492
NWENMPIGNYSIKAKIFDIEGLTAESNRINISVIEESLVNQAPSVSIIDSIKDQSFTIGEDILIQTNASDPENEIQKVEFFYGEQLIATVNSPPFEFNWENMPIGNYSIKAKIFDIEGLTAESNSINISVNEPAPVNQAPEVSISQPTQNQSFTFGQNILIQTNASDPENEIQKVEFFQGDQLIATVDSAPFEFNWENTPIGNYSIKAKIFDNEGLTAESNRIDISVIEGSSDNQAPSVSIIDPIQDQTFTLGEEILIRTNAADPENGIQKVEFFYGEQIIAYDVTAPYEFNWENAPVGNHVLKTKIFDEQGLTAESSRVNISINDTAPVNQAPSVSIIDPIQDQSFRFGHDILIKANASDPENKIWKVEFFYGEEMIEIVTSAPYEVVWKNAPAGDHILKSKIFDHKGLTAESSRIHVNVNHAPAVSITHPIQGQVFRFGQDILISANVSDHENKIQKVEFFYGEQMIAIIETAPYEIIWKNAPAGDHILKTKIFDHRGLTAESSRINIAVDHVPTVEITNPIQNQTYTLGEDIMISTEATDPENKIQKVEFFYGEQMIAIVDTAPYEVNWKKAPFGNHVLKAKIFDSKGLTDESSRINITVENSAESEVNLRIINPVNNQVYTSSDLIPIEVIKTKDDLEFDSLAIYLDDTPIGISYREPYKFELSYLMEGERKLTARAFKSGEMIETEILLNIFAESDPSTEVEVFKPSQEIKSKEQFSYSIGPNSTDNILNLFLDKLPKNEVVEVQLFDLNGSTLNSFETNTDTGHITLEIGTFPAGIYFIRIIGYNMDYGTKRIIKD